MGVPRTPEAAPARRAAGIRAEFDRAHSSRPPLPAERSDAPPCTLSRLLLWRWPKRPLPCHGACRIRRLGGPRSRRMRTIPRTEPPSPSALRDSARKRCRRPRTALMRRQRHRSPPRRRGPRRPGQGSGDEGLAGPVWPPIGKWPLQLVYQWRFQLRRRPGIRKRPPDQRRCVRYLAGRRRPRLHGGSPA
jgi:hypothetical protein